MILRRFLETVLSALGWLIDMLFPQLVLLTVVLVLGLGALFLLLAWRSRLRSVSLPVRPQS
jgi:protein-S-isoprenylcysteine O-methyltransferase Ste14